MAVWRMKTVVSATTAVTNQSLVDLGERSNVVQGGNVSDTYCCYHITIIMFTTGRLIAAKQTKGVPTHSPEDRPQAKNPYSKISPLTFAVGMLNGTLQPSPGVNIPWCEHPLV